MNHDPIPQMLVVCQGEQWGVQRPDGHFVKCVSAKLAYEKACELDEIERLYALWMTRNVPLTSITEVAEAVKQAAGIGVKFAGHSDTQVHFDMCGASGYIEQEVPGAWDMTLLGHTVHMGSFSTENELRTMLEKAPLAANRARHAFNDKRRAERGEGNLYLPLTW